MSLDFRVDPIIHEGEDAETCKVRASLNTLVLRHLASEGLAPELIEKVLGALPVQDQGSVTKSELLTVYRDWLASTFDVSSVSEDLPHSPCDEDHKERKTGHLKTLLVEGLAPHTVEETGAFTGICGEASTSEVTWFIWTACAFVVVVTSLIFLPCVKYGEWFIDELFAAVRNPDARGETPLLELLSHDFWGNTLWEDQWTHKSYRPLVIISYMLQYKFMDTVRPEPLRAFNVVLHSVNSVLLFVLARRRGAALRWATLGACLFAVHPTHCENVVYLVGRADAMATHCWLLALLAWPSSRPARLQTWLSAAGRLGLVVMLAVVGGLCKETGFCVLFQLAISEMTGPRPLKRSVMLLLSFALVFKARSWFTQGTSAGFSHVDTPVQYHSDVTVRFFSYLYLHAKYAQLMVFPWTLCWDYSLDALPLLRETWRDVRILAVASTYLAVVFSAAFALRVRSRPLLAGLGNILVPFVPASNLFFIVGVTVGERLLYPCNVGWTLLVATAGTRFKDRSRCHSTTGGKRKGPFVPWFLLGLSLLGVYMYRCGHRVHQWQSGSILFVVDAEAYPRSVKTRHMVATVLHKEDRLEEALIHYNASLALFKHSALTEFCMAQIYIEMGLPREALKHFDSIWSGHFMGFGSHNKHALFIDYGMTLMMLQRWEEALDYLLQGLDMNEDVPHALNGVGYTFMQYRRVSDAMVYFEKGLFYDPDNAYLWNNLGVALMHAQRYEEGSGAIARAFKLAPEIPAFVHNTALIDEMVRTQQWPNQQLTLELFFNRGI